VGLTVTVIGVGFFDAIHTTPDGQAPNGVELHPVLALYFAPTAFLGELLWLSQLRCCTRRLLRVLQLAIRYTLPFLEWSRRR
jgi:hypothetical protein